MLLHSTLLATLCSIQFLGISFPIVVELLIIIFLLAASGFASASEAAFFSLTPQHLEQLNQSQDDKLSQRVLHLLEKKDYLLATILVTNNFINVALVVISALTMQQMFDFSEEPIWGFVIETVVITFLLLLLGEIVPKIVATRYPVPICRGGSGLLMILGKILKPIDVILVKSTSLLRNRMHHHAENLSMDELQTALEITSSSMAEDKELLEGIVRFGNIDVGSIMTSRLDMKAIELRADFQTVLNHIEESGYSRIPVYDRTPDNIKGILYIKDLIPHLNKGNTFRWQTLIRPATFVPETRKIDDLLEDFQKLHVHIAIVVDEFGGTLGLVTMEDVLEEIVGDISDEYDEEEQLYSQTDDNNYIFEAKIQLNDFFKIVDLDPEDLGEASEEAETLAGLLLYLHEEMPKQRERIVLGPCTFIVLSVNKRRIIKVKTIIDRTKINNHHHEEE